MKNEIEIDLKNIDNEAIKIILWKLIYNPEEAMDELDIRIKPSENKNLANLILEECKNSSKELKFAGETPYLETYGIDLGITNPVVRDVLLEKCYEAYEEGKDLEKISNLLMTQEEQKNKDGKNVYESRIFGGLRALGFSEEESNYLKDKCNFYPVGLFIKKRLAFDKKSVVKPAKKMRAEDIKVTETANEKVTTDISKIIENQALIQTVFSGFEKEGTQKLGDIEAKLEFYLSEIPKLEALVTAASELKEKGIPLEYLFNKKLELGKLFDSISNF